MKREGFSLVKEVQQQHSHQLSHVAKPEEKKPSQQHQHIGRAQTGRLVVVDLEALQKKKQKAEKRLKNYFCSSGVGRGHFLFEILLHTPLA